MENKKLPIVLFNGPVITTTGLYRISDIELGPAKKLVEAYNFISAIGHEATAEIMSELLGVSVPNNRIKFEQAVDQLALVFNLNERPLEGVILSKAEINKIGYSLKLIKRLE